MPVLKNTCLECKEKHVKCTEDLPKCRRCSDKNLECVRTSRRRTFRHGSSAKLDQRFSGTQTWVESSPREFRLHRGSGGRAERLADEHDRASRDHVSTPGCSPVSHQSSTPAAADIADLVSEQTPALPESTPASAPDSLGNHCSLSPAEARDNTWRRTEIEAHKPTGSLSEVDSGSLLLHHEPDWADDLHAWPTSTARNSQSRTILEACLLSYYIEELSHWFDMCNCLRRYEHLVPERAKDYPPLQNAIYAVSARHLCRLPQCRTRKGIIYRGQVLPDLTPETAVEYMLRCIPALRSFHVTMDEDTRVLMVATAVILRQFEEMEDDEDGEEDTREDRSVASPPSVRVNFLSIINAALRDTSAEITFVNYDLLNVSYWIALRQEVYNSLLKGYPPEMSQAPQKYGEVSPANQLVMHASHVTQWLFKGKSPDEWLTLKNEQTVLDEEIAPQFQPLLALPANRTRGEIFPTIWFKSTEAMAATQHLMIAKMILLAESPSISKSSDKRSAYREVEKQVRTMVLDLCGTAMHDEKTPPSIVNAALAIHLYGHFFVDEYERHALKGVIRRFSDMRAWPVPRSLREFQ